MQRLTQLILSSVFVVSGLLGCGGPPQHLETSTGTENSLPIAAPVSAALSDEQTASTSSAAEKSPAPSSEGVRCGPVETGPCSGGPICNVECCNFAYAAAWVSCGECQHVGNQFCAAAGSGLKKAYWSY